MNMENIDIVYAVLGTLVVSLTVLLVNRKLSTSSKVPKEDPWAGIGRTNQTSDYFYTED
tara:strand:+ start:471 stop:647 length:177 start_codon:yes stop_codon:yes gene_type:complete